MNDPIVDEVRRIRDEFSKSFNYDLDAMLDFLQEQQNTSGRKYVTSKESLRKAAENAKERKSA